MTTCKETSDFDLKRDGGGTGCRAERWLTQTTLTQRAAQEGSWVTHSIKFCGNICGEVTIKLVFFLEDSYDMSKSLKYAYS